MTLSLEDITEFRPSTSWQGRAAASALRTFVKPVVARVPLTRRVMKFSQLGFDTVTLALPVHPDVHIAPADVGGVPGEWLITGREVLSGRVVLYLHGGAYFFGSPRSHRSVTWRLSRACRAKVLALDYRQPPDWHYPAPLVDAVSAYRALLEQGYKPQNIVIAGDSAGGNLTLVTLLALRDQGLPLPAAGVLISPWADMTCSGDTLARNADIEPMIPINVLRFVSASYSRGEDPAAPMLSPIHADLTGLPPLMIQVSSSEVLLSDAERVARRALECGVPCRYQVWEGMIHVFQALAGWVPEASLAVRELGAFVDEQIRAAGGEHQVRRRARLVTARGR
ncbi:MAG: alpha/beta hydrolase [Alcanivoracaceae bacterium]